VFNENLTKDQFESKLHELSEKYFHLVWYARKGPSDDTEYWEDTPEHIKTKALNEVSRVEEFFPEETGELKEDETNWTHGFNSGCLAAFRYIQTCFDTTSVEDDETGKLICYGGIEQADEEFPFLDT